MTPEQLEANIFVWVVRITRNRLSGKILTLQKPLWQSLRIIYIHKGI